MFFVGLSAGGLIISSVPNAFGMKGFGGISKVAIWTSVCCTCAAIGFVVVDLGRPGPPVGAVRVLEPLQPADVGHPGAWHLPHPVRRLPVGVPARRGRPACRTPRSAPSAWSRSSWPSSCTTSPRGSSASPPAHEFWHTALMGPWFVASALDCGTALVLIVCLALRQRGLPRPRPEACGQPRQDAGRVRARRPVLLRLRPAHERVLRRRGRRGRGDAHLRRAGARSSGRRSRSWPPRSPSSFVPRLRTDSRRRRGVRPRDHRRVLQASCRFSWAASRFRTWICQALPRSMPLPTGRPAFTGAYQGMVYCSAAD